MMTNSSWLNFSVNNNSSNSNSSITTISNNNTIRFITRVITDTHTITILCITGTIKSIRP